MGVSSSSRPSLTLSDFDFELPEALIAQSPLERRDASRLLVLPLNGAPMEHRKVKELAELLLPGDLLVFNDARVIPARLRGRKSETGGKVELLLVEAQAEAEPGRERWLALAQSSKKLRVGQKLEFGAGLKAAVVGDWGGGVVVELSAAGDALLELLWKAGEIPLPPYIRSEALKAAADPLAERYQTVFARKPGASAAPTAGLHFTHELLAQLQEKGIRTASLTLLVGPGTFLPVRSEDLSQHSMHAESYDIPQQTVDAIEETKARGGRVVAVGTTALRALEAAALRQREAGAKGLLLAGEGRTELFIVPGFEFRVVDGLMSNFHLPKSTLLMLVAAFAGRQRVLRAYDEAVREGYRFFSYGDATLMI